MPKKGHSEEQFITVLKQYESGVLSYCLVSYKMRLGTPALRSIAECNFAADSSGQV